MKSLFSKIASLATVVFVVGCANAPNKQNDFVLANLEDVATGPLQTRPAVMEVNGKPAILYSTKNDRVMLQIGERTLKLDETARVKQGASYFQLNKQAEINLQALWWSHQDGKNIYFAGSVDGGGTFAPVSMVNNEHGVLPPFSLVHGENGVFGVTYHDERLPNYQAFFNRSRDGGRTWAQPDVRLDTPPAGGRSSDVHEPQMVQLGDVWISAWTDNVRENEQPSYRIVSRRSLDAGLTWLPPEVLYRTNHHISALVFKAYDGQAIVVADELNRGIFAFASRDKAQTWNSIGILAGTDGVSNSGIELAFANDRVHLVWMRDRADDKTRIFRASFDIRQQKWLGTAQRVDTKDFENTRSTSPVISTNTKGKLITAWVDYRDIRPNIYLSFSIDQGTTWSNPLPLLAPGEVAAGWPTLIPWQGEIAIAYETYPTDVVAKGKFFVRLLPFADNGAALLGLAPQNSIDETKRRARLEERIKVLWDSRVNGKYDIAYDLFDFAYKAATPKKYYLDNVGVITYLEYKPEAISISGNEATANMKVKYEVKPTVLPMTGKPISVPPFDAETPTRWVWVANDWFLVYTPSFDPPMLKY